MISFRQEEGEQKFVARLAAKAAKIAQARAENRLRTRKRDPWRWRNSRLLWPLFTKG